MNEKKRVLVADDEKEIRDILKLLLTGEGYEVISAASGEEALEMASEDIDLYVLDVNMPGLSGFMTALELRKRYETPIIFLTAYSNETDKIMGFSAGADDYVVKPFSNMELIMRVRAILRRSNGRTDVKKEDHRIPFSDLLLDLESQSVIKNEEIIGLTYTEFQILKLFVTHKKKIYSLDNIYESIWEETAVGDNTIMVHVKNIRKKLGDDSRNPKYIKTAWGKGYYIE